MSEQIHTVRRAVIVAAGLGKRLQPLTLETPKPLLKVNGVRMIDTIVRALHQQGIHEITVVTGYKKEQFRDWARDIPGIRLLENPWYDTCNNISSLYVARDCLQDCIILDGDQVILRPEALSPRFARSGYNAVWCEGETEEWLMQEENGIVTSCSRTGGSHGWQLFSISRWTAEDGQRLGALVKAEFEAGNRQIYWDDVPMFLHFSDFTLGIRKMNAGDVLEIDSLRELEQADPLRRDAGKPAQP